MLVVGRGLTPGSFAGKSCMESIGGSLQLCCLKRLTPPDLPLQKSCLPGLLQIILFLHSVETRRQELVNN